MLDRTRLLAAIAQVESGGGSNNVPRFEVSYMPPTFSCTIQGRLLKGTGRNYNNIVADRWKKWGLPSAASYSRWQILYHTAADMGYIDDPRYLWFDEIAQHWVERRLDQILKLVSGDSDDEALTGIARSWNGGNPHATWVTQTYIDQLVAAYNVT